MGSPGSEVVAPGSTITVLTLLYDPEGRGHHLFRRCAQRVFAQTGCAFNWIVSVSEVSAVYEALLAELAGDSRVTIVRQAGIEALGDHLAIALDSVHTGKVHLLCHDDAYTSARSLATIGDLLDRHAALAILPWRYEPDKQPIPALGGVRTATVLPESWWARTLDEAGLNLIGGLSTAAWSGPIPSENIDSRLSLLGDLGLRRAMRHAFGSIGMVPAGLIVEANWPGQSQYALEGQRNREFRCWCEVDATLWRRAHYVFALASKGYRRSATSWLRSTERKPLGVAVSTVALGAGEFIHLVRRVSRRARRWLARSDAPG